MKAFRVLSLILFALIVAPQPGNAASAAEINAKVNATLRSFDKQNPSARELGRKAAGFLVFSDHHVHDRKIPRRFPER
jgi:hypothetical protein